MVVRRASIHGPSISTYLAFGVPNSLEFACWLDKLNLVPHGLCYIHITYVTLFGLVCAMAATRAHDARATQVISESKVKGMYGSCSGYSTMASRLKKFQTCVLHCFFFQGAKHAWISAAALCWTALSWAPPSPPKCHMEWAGRSPWPTATCHATSSMDAAHTNTSIDSVKELSALIITGLWFRSVVCQGSTNP